MSRPLNTIQSYVVVLSVAFALFFIVPTFAKATELEPFGSNSLEILTEQEIQILQEDVGLSLEEIETRTPEFLRSLIEEGAKKKFITSDIVEVNDELSNTNTMIRPLAYTDPQGTLKGHIQIEGEAYEVSSDRTGYKKFRLIGRWKWISVPQNTLTDGFAIGVADAAGFSLPESGGKVVQHTHDYWTTAGGSYRRDYGVNPDDFSPNGGVGYFIDLRQGQGAGHYGHMSQYVYTEKKSGSYTV